MKSTACPPTVPSSAHPKRLNPLKECTMRSPRLTQQTDLHLSSPGRSTRVKPAESSPTTSLQNRFHHSPLLQLLRTATMRPPRRRAHLLQLTSSPPPAPAQTPGTRCRKSIATSATSLKTAVRKFKSLSTINSRHLPGCTPPQAQTTSNHQAYPKKTAVARPSN